MSLTCERVILTPEHVQLRLRPAGLGARFLALLVDAVIVFGAATFIRIGLGMVLPQSVVSMLGMVTTFVLVWGYQIYFEVWGRGQTPGKRALGLRVVDGRGLPITLPQSFIRNIVRVLDLPRWATAWARSPAWWTRSRGGSATWRRTRW
ncbi:MAG: RDD family protein [Planctomycetes bacterium]|nr:RDD family protein [Planctomycetota bacterium]